MSSQQRAKRSPGIGSAGEPAEPLITEDGPLTCRFLYRPADFAPFFTWLNFHGPAGSADQLRQASL
jgi:hypothetical protein